MTENIIFVKYSNDRDGKYKIKTVILYNDDLTEVVRKYPLNNLSWSHIENMFQNQKKLCDNFDSKYINILESKLNEQFLEYKYIEGINVDVLLDEIWENEGIPGIANEMLNIFNIIYKSGKKHNFKKTKEFIDIFGDLNFCDNTESFKISNIDLLFSNMVLTDKINIFDYEWVFNFDIPIEYIFYRMVYNYCHYRNTDTLLNIEELFKKVQINDIEKFKIMDNNFTKYVKGLGNNEYLRSFELKSIIDITDQIEKARKKDFIQVFYSEVDDFSEEKSIRYYTPLVLGYSKKTIQINIKNCKSVRIDFFEMPINLKLISVSLKLQNGGLIVPDILKTNAEYIEADKLYFLNNDPQIYLDIKEKIDINHIEIEYEIIEVNPNIAINLINKIQEKENVIQEKENVIQEKENVIQEKENVIQEKENVIQEKENVIQEKEDVIQEKENVIQEKENVIQYFNNLRVIKIRNKLKYFKDKYIKKGI